jgi:MFS family permease
MVLPLDITQNFYYFLHQDMTKLYITVAIRNLAVGMISIFTPIYMYQYFGNSLPLLFIYFGSMFGLFGVLAVPSGMLMSKIGSAKIMLLSSLFLIFYYVSLFSLDYSNLLLPVTIVTAALGMSLFWPAFHTDFTLVSSREKRGREASRVNIAMLVPTILSPLIGGVLLSLFGFHVLFAVVSVVLIASATPLFYRRERRVAYTDSMHTAWARMLKKQNWKTSVGLLSDSYELGVVHFYIWPLFLYLISIDFSAMGGIASFALVASSLFMLYAGRISDTQDRPWLLNIGSVWTSIAWILKYFVHTPFSALLAQTIYRISRAAATVPFRTFFFEKAADKGLEMDEYIVYREIITNISRLFFFFILAVIYYVYPSLPIQATFIAAAVASLGLMFMGKFPFLQQAK